MRRFPRARFFLPSPLKARRAKRRVLARATEAPAVLHLTHGGCLDGASCDALLRMARGDAVVRTIRLDPAYTLETLATIRAVAGRGRTLVVSDLSLQRGEGARAADTLADLARSGWTVEWRDHHHKQWSDEDAAAIGRIARLRLDTTGTECGATLVQKDLLPDDAFARDLAEVVRDHDLWLLLDPRSRVLQSASSEMGSRRFVELLLLRDLEHPEILAAAAREARRKADDGVWARSRARVERRGSATVGSVYGDVPTNEVLHELLTARGCDAAVLFRPTGAFSLRSRKDLGVCHRVAQRFGGGGHPNASGGRLALAPWRLPVYWVRGERLREAREIVRALLDEVEAEKRR